MDPLSAAGPAIARRFRTSNIRRMFGGWGLDRDGVFFSLVARKKPPPA
jgi:hypothetical protein